MRFATVITRTLAAAAIIGVATGAMAQSYPTKPITLIVPWPAGGSTDVAMRAHRRRRIEAPRPADRHRQQGGRLRHARPGSHGGDRQARRLHHRADADHGHAPAADAEGDLGRAKDFTYIVHLTGYTFGITTKADSPFKTWKDVVEFAKANPGKVTYATPGAGTSLHIGMEQIAEPPASS